MSDPVAALEYRPISYRLGPDVFSPSAALFAEVDEEAYPPPTVF